MGARSFLRSERGSVTVEFFLVVPMLIIVLAASLELVGVVKTRIELLGAVREGARVAATTPDPAKAVEAVEGAMAPSARDRLRVSVTRPSVVGKPARVTAVLRHEIGAPLLTGMAVDISASAVMLVER